MSRNTLVPESEPGMERGPVKPLEVVQTPLYVVGIGASAGGLEALEEFFDNVPEESRMAFLVIQHLSPDFKSMMDELLARHTRLPIQRIEDGMRVTPGTIYLIPPKKEVTLVEGTLRLTDKDPQQGLSLPIDHFLESLAEECGERAIAVILSGTGSDGSRGVRAVHDAGGLVLVQSPETARFDGMPLSAQETGAVDLVLPPAEMPMALVEYAADPQAFLVRRRLAVERLHGIDAVFDLLRREYGIDFSHYKPSTVSRRIQRRLGIAGDATLEQYAEQLRTDPEELNALYRDLLIGVTQFFRDREAFQRLRNDTLPHLLATRDPDADIRMWVAGCATGEEAYSLAILLHETCQQLKRPFRAKVFATDVHHASLDFASAGVYERGRLAEVSPERLRQYFRKVKGRYQISDEIRKAVVFAPHNVLKDAPFTNLDLISCRNLLIYFQQHAQKRALSMFHFGLRRGGILFLGSSETPGEIASEFEALDERCKIYRKRRDVRLPADFRLPLTPSVKGVAATRALALAAGVEHDRTDNVLLATYDALLDRFVPPSLLVTADRAVLDVLGGAEQFLRVKRRRPTSDLMDLLRPELKTAVAGALQRAIRSGESVSFRGLTLPGPDGEQQLHLEVLPIDNPRAASPQFLIVFEPIGDPRPSTDHAQTATLDAEAMTRDRIAHLESDLQHSRESLQATIEELETSNEELQATNEELVASNEELQSTNEELHSVNEELYTVNAEHQKKIDELNELNRDVNHLLSSLDVSVLFLDGDLRIRRMTPRVKDLFRVHDQDVGRPLCDFATNIDYPSLSADLERALRDGERTETEVYDRIGRCFLIRVMPYRVGRRIDGVVITFTDVSTLDQARRQVRESERRYRGTFEHAPVGIAHVDLSGRWIEVNDRLCEILNRSREDLLQKSFQEITHPDDLPDDLRLFEELKLGATERGILEKRYLRGDGSIVWVSLTFSLQRDDEGTPLYGIKVVQDISRRKAFEEQLRVAVRQRDQFLAMLSHELRNPMAAVTSALEVLDRPDIPDESRRAAQQVLRRQTRQMRRLLDDLLDASRITQNKVDFRPQILDLRVVVREAADSSQSAIDARRQSLTVSLPEQPVWVNGDSARLLQIVDNLLTNATKYTPQEGRIELFLTREDSQAVLRVRDNGRGIAPEMLSSIFDMFVQSGRNLDRSDGGMGLGLTLVKGLVELHGGSITAVSDGEGAGSEFTVRLPLTAPPSSRLEADHPQREAAGPFTPLRIVVVEDNPDSRDLLTTLLRFEGHHVTTVADGQAGIDVIRREQPDVALVDIGIPGVTGYDLARRIRELQPPLPTRLIAVTGYGQPQDVQAALAAGFDGHLTKPVEIDEVKRILAAVMQSSAVG